MSCTTILAGKKVTVDGSTIIARNDDGGFDTKHIVVVKPEEQQKTYKSVISHLEIELPDNPLRFTMSPNIDTKEAGLWPASGINEANVGMTATETVTSNPRVMGADPFVEYKKDEETGTETPGGIGEEDLVAIVLPYIHSAREGVLRVGELLEKYGTYESNGMAFNDSNEVWWLETIGGHHWIAKRVPDDRVVIMPNQFGLDNFDFDDAFGEGKDNLCSADLLEFVNEYHLYKGKDGVFNPRLAFGSKSDHDHIYNTPRAWYMTRYFLPTTYRYEGDAADFTPVSDNLPWSILPEEKVTIEDIRFLLGSYYQDTPYDPYDSRSPLKGKYRTIAVPNSDVCAIMQIRGDLPAAISGISWYSMGGSGFTACFPVYTNVSKLPKYIGETTKEVSTDYMYWHSRLIAALVDAHYHSAAIFVERYTNQVFNESRRILNEYDARIAGGEAAAILEEANEKITAMVKKKSDEMLGHVLKNASEHMKIRFHRGDN